MNVALLLVVFVVVANAPRRRLELPTDTWVVAIGSTIALAGYVVLALVADPLLDALDVSAPNARIAAGFVIVVGAIVDLVRRPDPEGPALDGRAAALVPAAFPILFRPDLGALAIAAGADPGAGWTVVAAFAASLTIELAHAVLPLAAARPLARVAGTAAVGLGIVVILDGVFAV